MSRKLSTSYWRRHEYVYKYREDYPILNETKCIRSKDKCESLFIKDNLNAITNANIIEGEKKNIVVIISGTLMKILILEMIVQRYLQHVKVSQKNIYMRQVSRKVGNNSLIHAISLVND